MHYMVRCREQDRTLKRVMPIMASSAASWATARAARCCLASPFRCDPKRLDASPASTEEKPMPVKPRAGPKMGVAHEIRNASPAA